MATQPSNYDLFFSSRWCTKDCRPAPELSPREKCIYIAERYACEFCAFMCLTFECANFMKWSVSARAPYDLYEFPELRTINNYGIHAYLPIKSVGDAREYLMDIVMSIICNSTPGNRPCCDLLIFGIGCVKNSRWKVIGSDHEKVIDYLSKKGSLVKDVYNTLKMRSSMLKISTNGGKICIVFTPMGFIDETVIGYREGSVWTFIPENFATAATFPRPDRNFCDHRTIPGKVIDLKIEPMFLPKKTRVVVVSESNSVGNIFRIPEILMLVLEYVDYDLNALFLMSRLVSSMNQKAFNHLMMLSFCDRETLAYLGSARCGKLIGSRPFDPPKWREGVPVFPKVDTFREFVRDNIKYCLIEFAQSRERIFQSG